MANGIQPKNLNKPAANLKTWFSNRKNQVIAGVVVLGVIIFSLIVYGLDQSGRVRGLSEEKPTININQTYEITARTKERKATDGKLKLVVTNAQITNSILVQGKVARPIKGKVFLVLNMEIENPYKVALHAFPVDLFRFIRSDDQRFAPSVHQGTVEIRPQATKKSNVAFVVDPNDKKFKIEVGEIGKEKQTLEVTFR